MDSFTQRLQRADRLAAITQRVGFALWQLQELEGVAAQYFVLVTQAKKGMGLAEGNALVDKVQGKTFGTILHQITKAGLLNSELERCFTKLLSERNWLVHRSRSHSRNAIYSDPAMQKIILRLDAMAEESNTLLKQLGIFIERHVKEYGVSEQYIEKMANQLLKQWHASDAV
jgi:hypothetical protein